MSDVGAALPKPSLDLWPALTPLIVVAIAAPLIGSAGWVAYQAMLCVRSPDWVRMFQSALVLRLVLVAGWICLPSGVGSTNERTPCLSPHLPVAIDVQRIGESIG